MTSTAPARLMNGRAAMNAAAADVPPSHRMTMRSPIAVNALLATSAGGVAPFFVGAWGGIDVIRDPYADAASGGLRLTALATMDVTVARGAQLELLTGLQVN